MNNPIRRLRNKKMREIFVTLFIRIYQYFRIILYKYLFSTASANLSGVNVNQPIQFVGKGKIIINGGTIGVWPSAAFLTSVAYFESRRLSASIIVKKGTVFNNGAVLIADKGNITIGENCLIGSNVFITDSDFHGLNIEDRRNDGYECLDVIIGNDVFIGNDVKILKGVQVGDNSVIGVGSIVVKNIPANTLYAGVPAKLVRYL
jgi:maltose O-acetyltransferase